MPQGKLSYESILYNLQGKKIKQVVALNLPKERTLEFLRDLTGEDFGYDVDAWRLWFEEQNFEELLESWMKRMGI